MPSAGRRSLCRRAGSGGGGPGPPTITSITPNSGLPTTAVTVAGTGFSGGNLVINLSGEGPLDNIIVVSNIEATATVPSFPPTIYDVIVVTDLGQDTLVGGFELTE